jgi:3-dehydroquinate synthase
VPDSPLITVSVALGERSYDIVIGDNLLGSAAQQVAPWVEKTGKAKSRQAAVVTDENVRRHAENVQKSLLADGWDARLVVVPAGEATKRLEMVGQCYDHLVEMRADRRAVIFAVGGGVVGDLAGFVAATYNRGLPFIQCPTTLLADVDSSVGGKTGVNHPKAKNLIGAFHQPLGVLIDTSVLTTLPDREYRAGLAEVVKYGVILDAEFFAYLEEHVDELNRRDAETLRHAIARSCRLKADVVEQDEFERSGLRAVLNYGHTFGHAFEAIAGYGQLLHGEAVSIGMVYASRLAERLGRNPTELTSRQVKLLNSLKLPTGLPNGDWPADEIIARMRLDKKAEAGRLRFVLSRQLGQVELVDDVPENLVRDVLK